MGDNKKDDSQVVITNRNNNDSVNLAINSVLSKITNDSSALSRRKHKRSQSGENEDENQKKKI
jgi:hypothetical protein